ncbi:MAG: CopG family transcriptional regulator [Deltaproteobacteria bacterium]|nr:CopG family transcriptional regulator [Deltaproteobacteria bacterium]
MKASDFDNKFESGEDITSSLELSKARRVNLEPRRINVDFPTWMVESLDREAKRLGITRQSIIKVWIAEMLERKVSRP